MRSFSLWSQPWIPVRTLDGTLDKVSLREAVATAHQLQAVVDPSPLVTVAIHRLILALLYRVYAPKNLAEWAALWRAGRFDPAPLDAYGERWSDRFDLCHPTHPFYQVPLIAGEDHPAAALVMEAASGNNPTLFDHGLVEGQSQLPLDRAACHLLVRQLFPIGFGKSQPFYLKDAPLTRGFVVEAAAPTLHESLLLNLMPLDRWRQLIPCTEQDQPFWEVQEPSEPIKEGTPLHGPLHYLTWQSRRIQLSVDSETGEVTGCRILQRYCLPDDGNKIDPGKAYVRHKERGWQPRRLQKDRAAWRITHLLLQAADEESRPALVDWLFTLRYHAEAHRVSLPPAIEFTLSGLTTDPQKAAKVELWRREEFGLPLAYLERPELAHDLRELIKRAGFVEALLRRTGEGLIWALGERAQRKTASLYIWTGKTGQAKIPPSATALARSLGMTARYWTALEVPFRRAMLALCTEEYQAVQGRWHEDLRQVAQGAFRSVRDDLVRGTAPYEILSGIDSAFHGRLNRLTAEEEEEAPDGSDADE